MSDSEEEYVVESIVAAKIIKEKRKRFWVYWVKWAGYDENEKTWEPIESFAGSEHFVDSFWARINTGGRDINNIKLFEDNEEFFPVGPPRGAKKRKLGSPKKSRSSYRRIISSPRAASLQSPPRNSDNQTKTVEQRPAKRRRGTSCESLVFESNPSSKLPQSSQTSRQVPRTGHQTSSDVAPSDDEPTNYDPLFDEPDDSPTAEQSTLLSPASRPSPGPRAQNHRERAANPRVKMLDDIDSKFMKGAISVKARLMLRKETDESSQSARPPAPISNSNRKAASSVKNRSSLLVFNKGKGALQTRKGFYKASPRETSAISDSAVVDLIADSHEIVPVPTGEELLNMAGFKDVDATLEDFIDQEAENAVEPVVASSSLSAVASRPFLAPSPSSESPVTSNFWTRPSIFGPLSSGLKMQTTATSDSTSNFSIIADSISHSDVLLILLDDLSPLSEIVKGNSEAPGKFYGLDAFRVLMTAFRAEGAGARVSISPDASVPQQQNFLRFFKHLSEKEVFVVSVGRDLLILLSSAASKDNGVGHLLHISPELLAQSDGVLATTVSIQDYDKYASAAFEAKFVPW